jgi:hypothetical protein
MPYTKHIFLFLVVAFFISCSNNSELSLHLKTIDSLSGSLNQKLSELQKADTIILEKALTKFNEYKQFIKQNVNDTLSKSEADVLQRFFTSGRNLEGFFINRKNIIARGHLVNAQLSKLVIDVEENTLDRNQLTEFMYAEKEQANDVIQKSFLQQQVFQTNLQEFKNTLPLIEELIKARNSNQLPTIVKDSTAL